MENHTTDIDYTTFSFADLLYIPPEILLYAPVSPGAKIVYSKLLAGAKARADKYFIIDAHEEIGLDFDEWISYINELIRAHFIGKHTSNWCSVAALGEWRYYQIIHNDEWDLRLFGDRDSLPDPAPEPEPEPVSTAPSPRYAVQRRKRPPLAGYVYLILASTGHYKIGRTKSVPQRMSLFGVQLPFTFEIVHVIETDDMCADERTLHERFASQRVNGEWFSLTEQDVEYIRGL